MLRRTLLGGLSLTPLLLRAALSGQGSNAPSPDVHISYGQSHRSNSWPSFGDFGIDPQPEALLALHVWSGPGGGPPGPLPNAGILPKVYSRIDGITSYGLDDHVSIGRCAVLTQQLLRHRSGKPAVPVLEYCHAYPGCNWETCADGVGDGLSPNGIPWNCGVTADEAIIALVNKGTLSSARFRSIGWTQGGADPNTVEQKLADMAAMTADYDGLELPGAEPLNFFISHQGEVSTAMRLRASFYGTVVFARANANGRTWGTTPLYAWPLDGTDYTHTGAYGTCRAGEFEGYAMYVVYDEGLGEFYPLWLSLTNPITISGQTITVPFDRPSGKAFANSPLQFYYDDTDGPTQWPQFGFHVRRNNINLAVTPSVIGMNVQLQIAEKLYPGDQLEVSYAFWGPGGGGYQRSGVGGNLMMAGPPSVLFRGKKINAWAWPFVETMTV